MSPWGGRTPRRSYHNEPFPALNSLGLLHLYIHASNKRVGCEEALGQGSTESFKACMNGVQLLTCIFKRTTDASEAQINLEAHFKRRGGKLETTMPHTQAPIVLCVLLTGDSLFLQPCL